MPQSLSLLYVHLAFGTEHREPIRRRCIAPLQGFEIEGATKTQAVGLGCDRSPLWGLRQTQMRALCLHVAENGHAANKGDENVETPAPFLIEEGIKGWWQIKEWRSTWPTLSLLSIVAPS